jgi:hypothetical protein
MVAGETENVPNTERGSTQDIRLERDTVTVTGDHLEHRIKTCFTKDHTGSKAGETDNTGLIIGHIDTVDKAFQQLTFLLNSLGISTFRGTTFGGNREMTFL